MRRKKFTYKLGYILKYILKLVVKFCPTKKTPNEMNLNKVYNKLIGIAVLLVIGFYFSKKKKKVSDFTCHNTIASELGIDRKKAMWIEFYNL